MNRQCPKCGNRIDYKTKRVFNQATKRNCLCLSCGRRRDTRGSKNPFWGKSHSGETIKRLAGINTGKTLSDETKRKMSEGRQKEDNANWKGGYLTCKCEMCGEKFESSDGRAKYCPRHAVEVRSGERNCNWNGGKIPVVLRCECCDREFTAVTSEMRAGRKFCSHACSNIVKNKKNKKFDTDIELAVEAYFKEKGMVFKKQVPLHGVTLADFVVDRIVIQCDGVYWHSRPGYVERDVGQDAKLVAMGYKVIRISDKEIGKEGVVVSMDRKLKEVEVKNISSWRDGKAA